MTLLLFISANSFYQRVGRHFQSGRILTAKGGHLGA